MPSIIESTTMRVTKSNTFHSDQERVMTKKLTQLKKEHERAARESLNRGGKTKLRREARTKNILKVDERIQETEEREEVPLLGVKQHRVVLKRFKRKPGHRGTGSTERY